MSPEATIRARRKLRLRYNREFSPQQIRDFASRLRERFVPPIALLAIGAIPFAVALQQVPIRKQTFLKILRECREELRSIIAEEA